VTSTERLIDAIGQGFGENGWEGLEKFGLSPEQQVARDHARSDLSAAAARVYATPDGAKLINWLVEQTLDRATWVGGGFTPLDQISTYGLFREGQNSIAASILKAIHEGRNPPTDRGELS
jgi:hypothetical protein